MSIIFAMYREAIFDLEVAARQPLVPMTILAKAMAELELLDEAMAGLRKPTGEGGMGMCDHHRMDSVGLGVKVWLCGTLARLHSALFCQRVEDGEAIAAAETWAFYHSEAYKQLLAAAVLPQAGGGGGEV